MKENKIVERLVELAESMFWCEDGPWKAYFEIPQVNAESIRGIYVVYSVMGENLDALYEWMAKVFTALEEKGGEYLYWRLGHRIKLEEKDGVLCLRTRIVVLNKALEPITLPFMLTTEGCMIKQLEKPTKESKE